MELDYTNKQDTQWNEITVGGVRYKLVPIEQDIVDLYEPEHKESVKKVPLSKPLRAEPKVYDYRERYKKRELRKDDLVPKPKTIVERVPNVNPDNIGGEGNLSKQVGTSVWVGEGVEEDF